MKNYSLKALGLASLLAIPAAGVAQTVSIPGVGDGMNAIPHGEMAYTFSLEGCGIDVAEIRSNQNVIVKTVKDSWGDISYEYEGLYAAAQYDSDGDDFVEGYYIDAPAMNLTADSGARTLTLSWNGVTGAEWTADVTERWLPMLAEQNQGVMRIILPEGLYTVTDKAGKEYKSAAQVIKYEFYGDTPLAEMSVTTPEPGTVLSQFDGCTFKFVFPFNHAPASLASDFMTSGVSVSYLPDGAEKVEKIYTPKQFAYDPETSTVKMTFAKQGEPVVFTEPGKYTVSAPMHQFTFVDAEGKTLCTTRSAEYSWTVETPTADFTVMEPTGYELDLEQYDQGAACITLKFPGGEVGEINHGKQLFATISRDGELIGQVPNSNYRQVRYDNIYAFVWQIAFWLNPDGKATVPGEYTVEIPRGFFLLNGVESGAKTLKYLIKGSPYTVDPAPGQTDALGEITFTWPGATKIELDLSDPEKHPYLFLYNDNETTSPVEYTYSVEGNTLRITPSAPVTTAGRWDAGVPAEIVRVYDEENAAGMTPGYSIYAIYTVGDSGVARPVSPLKTVKLLPGTIEMKMPQGHKLEMVNTACSNYVYPVAEDGSLGMSVARFSGRMKSTGSIELTNVLGAKTIQYLADGRYALVLGDHLFRTDQSKEYSAPMTYYFTVAAGQKRYTTDPYAGETVRELASMEITLDADASFASGTIAYITDGITTFLAAPSMKEGDSKTVVFTPVRPITIPGDYRLSTELTGTPAGTSAYKYVYGINTPFTIVAEGEDLYLPAPKVTSAFFADDLKSVTIALEYAEAGSVESLFKAQLYRVENGERTGSPVELDATAAGTAVTLTGEGLFSIGNYELVLPEGYYFTAAKASKECILPLRLWQEGIGSVTDAPDTYTVYSLQGVCLMRNASAERLSTLAPGLYIINGCKVLIAR